MAGMGSFVLDSVHQDESLDIANEETETFECGNKKKSYLFNKNTLLMGRWDINFIVGLIKGAEKPLESVVEPSG